MTRSDPDLQLGHLKGSLPGNHSLIYGQALTVKSPVNIKHNVLYNLQKYWLGFISLENIVEPQFLLPPPALCISTGRLSPHAECRTGSSCTAGRDTFTLFPSWAGVLWISWYDLIWKWLKGSLLCDSLTSSYPSGGKQIWSSRRKLVLREKYLLNRVGQN